MTSPVPSIRCLLTCRSTSCLRTVVVTTLLVLSGGYVSTAVMVLAKVIEAVLVSVPEKMIANWQSP